MARKKRPADAAAWLLDPRPDALLYYTEHLPNRRKVRTSRRLRLFACGCYRLIWDRIRLPSVRTAVEKTEDFADGGISRQELDQHRYPRGEPRRDSVDWHLVLSMPSLVTPKVVPGYIAWLVRASLHPRKFGQERNWDEYPPQADLVRDIFGNPFRPVIFNPAWRTSTAVALARQMYDSRDFGIMPILGDALQDAGCDNTEVLDHCRGPGPHVRGCWVVDLVLALS